MQTGVIHVERLDLSFKDQAWAFAVERRREIDEMFAGMQRETPALWNGRVLMLRRQSVENGVFKGEYLETDYASFAVWQRGGRPEAAIYDCFAAAAVLSADGAFLLGVMGAHTLNAGQVYFPCGTPDPSDVADGRVDLDFSVRRELKEETGLEADELEAEPGWTAVFEGPLIAHIKVLRSRQDAEALRSRMLKHLASEKSPELSGIRIVRGPADIDPAMRGWAKAFLARRFNAG
jgi:hypothetical protein